MEDNLNMWTQTCNQEYKPDYTLKIPERGVQTTDKPYRKLGRKNVLRKLLRIPYRRLKAGIFCVLTVFVCCRSSE